MGGAAGNCFTLLGKSYNGQKSEKYISMHIYVFFHLFEECFHLGGSPLFPFIWNLDFRLYILLHSESKKVLDTLNVCPSRKSMFNFQ